MNREQPRYLYGRHVGAGCGFLIIGRKEEEVNIRGMVFQVRQIFVKNIKQELFSIIYGLLILILIIYSRTISKRQW